MSIVSVVIMILFAFSGCSWCFIYQGKFKGLIRYEVEFESEKEVDDFIPPKFCGPEITNTARARYKDLVALSEIKFKESLSSL